MSRNASICVVFCMWLCIRPFQAVQAEGAAVRVLPPGFSVAPASLNFGIVNTGQSKVDSVIVTNSGTSTLIITNVAAGNAQFSVTPRFTTVAAGAKRTFIVTFAPVLPGAVQTTLIFTHSAAGSPDSVALSGEGSGVAIQPVFSVAPAALDFGTVTNGSNKRDSVTVTNTGNAALTITSVTSSSGRFTISPGNGTIQPSASLNFRITFAPTADGTINAQIRFNHNAAGGRDSVAVHGTGTGGAIKPVFSVSPTSLSYGDVPTGSTKRDSVTVTNTGTANLQITSVTRSNTQYSVTPNTATITPQGTRKFFITLAPTTPGLKEGWIRFNHNGDNTRDSISVSGTGSGDPIAPKWTASTPAIFFDTTKTGTSKRDSVVITNTGTATLTISNVTHDLSVFTVTPSTATIAAGASRTFLVVFAPTVQQAFFDTLVFTHNASKGRDTVLLSGEGTGGTLAPRFGADRALVDFDTVSTGMSRIDSVLITNIGTATLNVSNASSNNARFTITPRTFSLAPAASRLLRITFAPVQPGPDTARLLLPHNAAGGRDSIFAIGRGVGTAFAPVFTVDPHAVDFGTLQVGTTATDSVTVRNTGTTTLTITSINSTNAAYTASPRNNVSIAAGAMRVIRIICAPTVEGSLNAPLVFAHNGESAPDTVFLTGLCDSGLDEPVFKATPAALNMRGVAAGSSRVDSVVVQNTGRQTLNVYRITSTDPRLSVLPDYGTIAPSAQKVFFVTFTPADTTALNAVLDFTSNTADQHDTVTVSGRGLRIGSIAEARSAAPNAEVAFEGIVTRARGTALRMQDGTGAIAVRQAGGLLASDIAAGEITAGDEVRIWGRVADIAALRMISGGDFYGHERRSRGNPLPAAAQVTLAQIAASGEDYESELIRVSALSVTTTDTTFLASRTYQIADPSDASNTVSLRIPAAADGELDGRGMLRSNLIFTGVLTQSSNTNPTAGYQLLPIEVADLRADPSEVRNAAAAGGFTLRSIYPHPVAHASTITYTLESAARVRLAVHNTLGEQIAPLFDGELLPGTYQTVWDGRDAQGRRVPAGMYVIECSAVGAGSAAVQRATRMVVRVE